MKSISCKPCFQKVSAIVPLASLSDVFSQKQNPAILGGNASVRGTNIFAAEPVEVFEFRLHDNEPFEKLAAVLSKYQLNEIEDLDTLHKKDDTAKRNVILKETLALSVAEGEAKNLFKQENSIKIDSSHPFGMTPCVNCNSFLQRKSDTYFGGWIGYFGYELGRFIENLPGKAVDDTGLPVIRLAFYDKAILYNHEQKTFTLVALEFENDSIDVGEKFRTLAGWLEEAASHSIRKPPAADMRGVCVDLLVGNMTQPQYMEAIGRIKQYIIDGDTYQINFSQRFEADFNARPIDLFHWQNTFNPSPYAAFLAWDNTAIVSASPELFLQVNGDSITTKPIKGTRPRNPLLSDEAGENHRAFNDLVESEKEQAELAMIVDLERNDLARICVPGTRHVTCGREIEAFPTVYHAAGVVKGQLTGNAGPQRIIDILKATFPGGSITGAPKIRSMEIIDELEPTARGVYTGSIGWIGINFDLCWNIAIRTILIKEARAYVQTGGGIVADSVPAAEWAETLTKARALLAGIEAVGRHSPPC